MKCQLGLQEETLQQLLKKITMIELFHFKVQRNLSEAADPLSGYFPHLRAYWYASAIPIQSMGEEI